MTESSDNGKNSTNSPNCDSLRLIYEKTQDSAEHADALGWEATSIIWGSIVLLLGFVIEALGSESIPTQVVIIISSLLAIGLTWLAWWLVLRNNKIMRHKYSLCCQIESSPDFHLGEEFRQHSLTQRFFEEEHLVGKHRRVYFWMSVAFTALWVMVILASAFNIHKHFCVRGDSTTIHSSC